jgi:hypothetical protein
VILLPRWPGIKSRNSLTGNDNGIIDRDTGVKYYFIEDESPTVVEQVPQSLRFLEQVEF